MARYRDYAAAEDNRETLLLLHGGSTSLESWDAWIERLRGKFRIIAVDLPGHGLTGVTVENDYSTSGAVAFVEAFVRALGLVKPFVLVGHSRGGNVAWHFAITHPERVARLVLIAPGGIAPPAGPQGPAYKIALVPGGSWLLRRLLTRKRLQSGLQAVFYDESLVTPAMIDRYWAQSQQPGMCDAALARYRAPTVDAGMIARLNEIKVPTLLLWGRDDKVFPLETSSEFLAAIPDSQLVVYDPCGHFPMEEFPEHSARDLREFLSSTGA